MTYTLSDDQNTLFGNGSTYQAIVCDDCTRCEFASIRCPVVNQQHSFCGHHFRNDGVSIIWVKQETTKKRPHADLIIAWANGAEIQFFNELTEIWYDDHEPSWSDNVVYRIKPKSVPDVIRYMYIGETPDKDLEVDRNDANIMVVLDGSTGEVKSVQKL